MSVDMKKELDDLDAKLAEYDAAQPGTMGSIKAANTFFNAVAPIARKLLRLARAGLDVEAADEQAGLDRAEISSLRVKISEAERRAQLYYERCGEYAKHAVRADADIINARLQARDLQQKADRLEHCLRDMVWSTIGELRAAKKPLTWSEHSPMAKALCALNINSDKIECYVAVTAAATSVLEEQIEKPEFPA